MASPAADIFRQAAACIAENPSRAGNILQLGSPGRVVIAGDIHGHRRNLAKIISYASAGGEMPTLILQEIIHGPFDPRSGLDRSVEVMLRAARLKVENPRSVFFLMGNHDLAQVTGNEITKAGRGVCEAFGEGVRYCFGDDGEEVLEAVLGFCRSLPLAAKFDNGVLASHSLPSPKRAELAGVEILSRPYENGDFSRGGPAYEWTWGRDQSPEQLDALAAELDVEFFVLGHRHIEAGSLTIPNRAIAISSDGPQGCVFEFNCDQTVTGENAEQFLKPIVAM